MLECTEYERQCMAARKAKRPLPKLPKSLIAKKERTVTFDWEKPAPKPATQPPLPTGSEAAKNHTPMHYKNSTLTHPKILAARATAAKGKALDHAAKIFGDGKIDYAQDADMYPKDYPYYVRGRDSLRRHIAKQFTTRMSFYDGAMGTMIQKKNMQEEDFRGDRFKDWDILLKGNNDLLSITRPDVITEIYTKYLEAGSDMIGTNTFSGTTIAQADYKMEGLVYEINYVSARLARDACDKVTAKDPTILALSLAQWALRIAQPPSHLMWRIHHVATLPLMSWLIPTMSRRLL
jgi:hypothetical protein